MEKGNLIGEGNTAEVFTWGDDKILKLFWKGFNKQAVENEYFASKKVEELGFPVPKTGQMYEEDGRTGIIYEKISGNSMLKMIMLKPWTAQKNAKLLAQIHYRMHRYTFREEGISKQKDAMTWNIRKTEFLSEEKKQEVLELLNGLPDGDNLCHGDFHPGNIILNQEKAVVLDWMTAVSGNPAADVARTVMLIKDAALPAKTPKLFLVFIRWSRNYLAAVYLKSYLKLSGITKDEVFAWRIPVAAARLIESIPKEEKTFLLNIINKTNRKVISQNN